LTAIAYFVALEQGSQSCEEEAISFLKLNAIKIDYNAQVSTDISFELNKFCSDHKDMILDFYCSDHDDICCKSCIADEHRYKGFKCSVDAETVGT
jgi:hypothetical protein